MDISNRGLIEIMSLEGVCLDPYLDSVGVWTIGVGITKFDGKDPRSFGTITIEQAIEMFKDRIKAYTAPVKKSGLTLTQNQFDALTSFCFNVGEGNLRKLVSGRTVDQIGNALMLYTKPPEITARRQKEQTLFKTGKYSSGNKVLVFPVSPTSHHPVYSKGHMLDVSGFFSEPPKPIAVPLAPIPAADNAHSDKTPPDGLTLADVWTWLKNH